MNPDTYSTEPERPQRRPVLVVEDDDDLREVVAMLLRLEGFEVLEACHGRSALELLEQGVRPGLILLDLMMPEMSGEQFCEELSTRREFGDTPIVIWSGGKAASVAAERYGAIACLEKPAEWSDILELTSRHVGT